MAQSQQLDLVGPLRAHEDDDKLEHPAESELDEGPKPATNPVSSHPAESSPYDPVQERPVQWGNRVFGPYGSAVLLVEQHVRSALQWADRIYVLQRGSCVLEDSAASARDRVQEIESSYLDDAIVA